MLIEAVEWENGLFPSQFQAAQRPNAPCILPYASSAGIEKHYKGGTQNRWIPRSYPRAAMKEQCRTWKKDLLGHGGEDEER